MRFKHLFQRLIVARNAVYRYDRPLVRFSPLLFVLVFVGLLIVTSSQNFINTQFASAATGNIYPNGDAATGWANSTGSSHYTEIDEATYSNADYVSTGTGGAAGDTDEYDMTSIAGATAPLTSVQVFFRAWANGGCNGTGGSNCDTLSFRIFIDGAYNGTTNNYTVTGTEPGADSSFTWTGTWTGDDDIRVEVNRSATNGGGSPGSMDDDIRLARVYSVVTYTAVANLDQTHFRWRDDSAALNTSSGWLASEDAKPASLDTAIGDTLRLRTQVNNPSVTQGIQGFRLQWAVKGASCSVSTGWTRVDTASDAWEMTASSQYADGAATTTNLLTAGSVFVNGAGLDTDSGGDDTSANIQLDQNDYTEVEWAIRATVNATGGQSYCFRVVDNGGSIISTYSVYPEVTLFNPIESLITQESYIWEYDDGINSDSNSQQAAGDTAITSVSKGERLNLRAQLKNTGTKAETDNLALFYDRGDNIWTKVENDKPSTTSGSGCADAAWTCSTIDTGGTDNVGWYTDVVFDAAGVPWASYINQTTTSLEVAVYIGVGGTGCSGTTAWTCSVVDNTSAGGSESSITISDNGTIWISYKEVSSGNLQVAQYVGSGGTGCGGSTTWTCTTIDSGAETGWFTDIAINPKTGNPWISYANNGTPFAFEVAQYVGSGGTGCAVSTWTCYTVLDDANDYGAEYTGIAFDAEGTAWTSFHDDTNGDLYVAKYVSTGGTGCTSSAWTCTAVATANDSGDIGTAIVVDSTGIPYVAFREVSTGGDLKIAQYLGGATTGTGCAVNTWNCTTIDSTGDVGAYASLIIDPAGNMWIGYRDTTNTNPKIARYLGGETTGTGCAVNTWSCTSVKTGGDNDGAFTSLAIAPNGNIWFSFYDSTGGDAELAVLNRNADITPSSSLSSLNGVALSESHTDMTTTGDTTNRDDADCATATTWNNGIYSTTDELTGLNLPAGDVTTQCTEVSWTIDTSQAIEGTTYRFVIATNDNWRQDKSIWRAPVQINEYPTLTIESNTELRAAKAVNPVFANCALDTSWGCQTVHATNNTGNETYLKVSPEGVPWIAYQDTTATDLWVAYYVGSGGDCDTLAGGSDAWECTLVEATGTVSYFTSMNFDKEGKPWVAYTRGSTANLDVAVAQFVGGASGTGCGGGSTDWTCTTVASTNNIGSYVSIDFDESGAAMIAYRDETGGDLEFARYVGSGGNCDTLLAGSDAWQCTTIDATNNVGYAAAMEVAGDGTIWIAYQDFTTGAVKVAKYVGSGGDCDTTGGSDAWQCTKVDDRGTAVLGYDIDIAIDSLGRPWIAHLDNTGIDLELTRYVGGGTGNCNSIGTGSADWFCETIQATNQVGYTPGIAISPNDTALVSYWDFTTNRLKTAKYVGSGGNCDTLGGSDSWQCTDITTLGGYYSSIDFDASGAAWISHTGNGFTDLFIAKQDFPAEPLSANRLGPNIPSGDAKYRFDGLGYGDVAIDDSAMDVITGNINDTLLYTFEKEGITSGTKPIDITWIGQSTISFATNNAFLQIYRYGTTNVWETITTESTCAANTDCTITATVSSNVSEYTNNGVVSVRIYQDDHTTAQSFKTDLIEIKQPLNPDITQEAYLFENDDGNAADTNTQQAAGDTARTGVVKGERINLRTHIKNTGDSAPTDYALFYDKGDGIWSKVQNNAPVSETGTGCDASANSLGYSCYTVDATDSVGFTTSLAIDPSGNPWVSHYDITGGNLEIAEYVGSGGNCDTVGAGSDAWQCTTVDVTDSVGAYGSIAFDPSGNPWVAYQDLTSGDLNVAEYVGSGGNCDTVGAGSDAWQCTVVDATGTVGQFSSLAIDPSGTAWISYYDATNGDLNVAEYVGSGGNCDTVGAGSDAWQCTVVDATGTVAADNHTIAIDPSGNPWVAYQDNTNFNLEVAEYVGSGGNCDTVGAGSDAWQCTTVDVTNDVGFDASIAFDPSGTPWVTHYDSINGNLELAVYVGGGSGDCDTVGAGSADWQCSTIDATDIIGEYSSLAFDPSGSAWVSYYDATLDALDVAHYVGSGGNCDTVGAGSDAWQCTAIDSTGDVGTYTSITFDPSGNPWVSYRDVTNTDLKVVQLNRQAEITVSPSLAAVNSDGLSESHADMTTTVDTTNRDDADCITGGATWNNGFFSTEDEISQYSIPKGVITPQCTELNFTIDTSQSVAGATYRFAVATKDNWRHDKGMWRGPIAITQYPTLTIEADTNQRVSKAITPSFTGCNSYAAGSAGSADWSCVVVDDQTDAVGFNPQSIAFDSENVPWLAYGNTTNWDLIVSKYVGSGGNCDTYAVGSAGSAAWQCTVVAGLGINSGGSPSIAFDPFGTPWVATNTNANLMISKYVGSGGNCNTFDSATSGSTAWECYYIDKSPPTTMGQFASLAFTDNGVPWISYRDSVDNDIHAAYYVGSGGNCDTYEVASVGSDAWNCFLVDATNALDKSDMTLDENNIPWISYYDSTTGNLKVAQYIGSGGNCDNTGGSDAWQCTVVDDQTAAVGNDTSITTGSDGKVTIAYQNTINASLVTAEYVGSNGNCDTYAAGSAGSDAWQCTVVDDNTAGIGYDIEIAAGPDGQNWIVYQGEGGANVMIARYVGSGGNCDNTGGSDAWKCTVVDDQSLGVGDFPNIALDNSGIPWLIYQNWSNSSVVVAKSNLPPSPLGSDRGNIITPSGDSNYRLDSNGYADIVSDDSLLDEISGALNDIEYYSFEKTLSTNTKGVEITWIGQSSVSMATNNTRMQVYRYGSANAWEDVTVEVSCAANIDCIIQGSIGSASEYTKSDGAGGYLLSVRVAQNKHTTTQTLRTDTFDAVLIAEPQITQEGYIFENDDGTSADTNTPQVAGATSISDVKKGERLNLRTQIKNTGGAAPADYGLFYDRGDGLWSKVQNDAPITGAGSGCDTVANNLGYSCTTVDATDSVGAHTSIAFDPSGNPWVSYQDTTNGNLEIAQYVGSGGNCDTVGAGSDAWQCTTVDATDFTGYTSSLAFDPSGNPWIVYVDYLASGISGQIQIAQYVGSGGNCDTVGAGSDAWQCSDIDVTDDLGEPKIAFDPSGNPWVSYVDNDNTTLEIAEYVGSGGNCDTVGAGSDAWQCTTVEDGSVAKASLAFDSSGSPVIAYRNSSIYIAQFVGSGGNCDTVGAGSDAWNCTQIESGNSMDYPSLAFDPSGRLWLSSYDSLGTNLRISQLSRQAEITLSPSMSASNGDVLSESHADMTTTVDTTNRDDADCITGGAAWNNGIFSTVAEIPDFATAKGTITPQCTELNWSIDTSQALEGQAYRFVVATKDNWNPDKGQWRGPIQINEYPTITVKTDSDVRYSKDSIPTFTNCSGSSSWGCVTVDSGNAQGNTVGSDSSIALDSQGVAWTSYKQSDTADVLAAKYVGSGGNCDDNGGSDAWQCYTVDATGGLIGTYTGIVIDLNDTPWIYYHNGTNFSAKVAKYVGSNGTCVATGGSSEWDCYTVDDPANGVGDFGSITLGKDNTIWIAYRDGTAGGLKVAKYVGSNGSGCADSAWTCQSIINGSSGYNASIVVDQQTGAVWVAHYTTSTGDVLMARYVGSGGTGCLTATWTCSTVQATNDVGGTGMGIALDKNGNAGISYYDASTGYLNFAEFVGSGGSCSNTQWTCTTVQTNFQPGAYSSLAYDSLNRPWISFKYQGVGSQYDLGIAQRIGGTSGTCSTTSWNCTSIDSTGDVGSFTSLSFDQSDTPWISYYDTTNSDLKVAKLHLPTSPLSSDLGGNFIKSGDLGYRFDDGRSPRSGEPGDCGSALAAMMGYCGVFDNQGDYDSLVTGLTESPAYAGAVRFDANTELPKIVWEGRTSYNPSNIGPSGDLVLQVYRFGTTNDWVTIATDSTSTNCNTQDCTLSGSASGTVSEYFEADGSQYWSYFRISQRVSGLAIDFKVDKFSATITSQQLRNGRVFEDGVRKPLLTE